MTARTSSRWLAALAALPLLVVPVLVAGPATAEDVSTGQWYLDAFHINDIHASGLTGEGVTIAVMDSPINTEVPALAGSNVEVQEPSQCVDESGAPLASTSTDLDGLLNAAHGTDVASMISGTGDGYDGQSGVAGIAPGAKVLYYAVSYRGATAEEGTSCPGPATIETALAADINAAIDAGADIISVSLAVNGSVDLSSAIARAHREGVVVLGALPNTGFGELALWPSAANGVVAVQAIEASGQAQKDPGTGIGTAFPWTTVAGPGVGILTQGAVGGAWSDQALQNGTSLATPAIAGFLALVLQKYPETTGNQLIQTLIRNTGVDDHDLIHDESIGYGIASATHMLASDPAQYPDENPLLTDDGNLPSVADSTGTGTSTEPPVDPGTAEGSIPWVPIIVGGVVGLLVLIGLIILIVILATRRSRSSAGPR
ncbi:MAG: peptidase [Rhodoglobus sp.]|nr:peptidase [Rhodoglobus sp.]